MTALLISMAGAVLSLFSSIYAADTVYLALVSIAGFAVVVVWLSIPMAQINFRNSGIENIPTMSWITRHPLIQFSLYHHHSLGHFCSWYCLG